MALTMKNVCACVSRASVDVALPNSVLSTVTRHFSRRLHRLTFTTLCCIWTDCLIIKVVDSQCLHLLYDRICVKDMCFAHRVSKNATVFFLE